MNANRRKEIQKAAELIAQAVDLLTTARDEEQEYFDNMPESLQGSERGQTAERAADALDNALNGLEGIDLEEALS